MQRTFHKEALLRVLVWVHGPGTGAGVSTLCTKCILLPIMAFDINNDNIFFKWNTMGVLPYF